MAVQPLSPATRLCLGGPLPLLLADRTRAPPIPDLTFYLSTYGVLAAVSGCCPPGLGRFSRVTHPSATNLAKKQAFLLSPFDLHVLSTPPAFVLSQDQTLRLILVCSTCSSCDEQVSETGYLFLRYNLPLHRQGSVKASFVTVLIVADKLSYLFHIHLSWFGLFVEASASRATGDIIPRFQKVSTLFLKYF